MRLPTTLLLCSLSLGLANAQQAGHDGAGDASSIADPTKPQSLRLLQRIYHPSRPSEPFVDRGSLLLSYPSTQATSHGPTAANFAPSEDGSLQSYIVSFVDVAQDEAESDQAPLDIDSAVYQLALEHPADKHPSQWHVSSVRACHLPHATSETFTLHLSASGEPYAVDYFVGPVPSDGGCPGSKKARRKTMGEVGSRITNSSVVLKSPTYPPLPLLRTPPPLTAEGRPVTPVQEKSFIQKYWMYFAIAFLAIAVTGGPAEEEGQQGGGGGQRR